MRIFLILVFLFISTNASADRVCIRKSDGVPIEYQSGDAPLGTLKKNALEAGYKSNEIEEIYMSKEDYLDLYERKIGKKEREDDKKKKDDAADRIKQKLNISDQDLKDLRDALAK